MNNEKEYEVEEPGWCGLTWAQYHEQEKEKKEREEKEEDSE